MSSIIRTRNGDMVVSFRRSCGGQVLPAVRKDTSNQPLTKLPGALGEAVPSNRNSTFPRIYPMNPEPTAAPAQNELRVCAARSRRRSSVGRTRGVGWRLTLWRFHQGGSEPGLIIAARPD